MYTLLYCCNSDIIFLKVIVNNSLGASDPVQTVGFTYPLPPKPVLQDEEEDISNVTVLVHLDLLSTHRYLNISLEVSIISI